MLPFPDQVSHPHIKHSHCFSILRPWVWYLSLCLSAHSNQNIFKYKPTFLTFKILPPANGALTTHTMTAHLCSPCYCKVICESSKPCQPFLCQRMWKDLKWRLSDPTEPRQSSGTSSWEVIFPSCKWENHFFKEVFFNSALWHGRLSEIISSNTRLHSTIWWAYFTLHLGNVILNISLADCYPYYIECKKISSWNFEKEQQLDIVLGAIKVLLTHDWVKPKMNWRNADLKVPQHIIH